MTIINLKDIEYLDTINKKLVFDNEQSSLTLLSFKKGVERTLHVDKKDETAQIIEGKAQITIGKEKLSRSIIVIEKIKKTPMTYPRKAGKPSKEPII